MGGHHYGVGWWSDRSLWPLEEYIVDFQSQPWVGLLGDGWMLEEEYGIWSLWYGAALWLFFLDHRTAYREVQPAVISGSTAHRKAGTTSRTSWMQWVWSLKTGPTAGSLSSRVPPSVPSPPRLGPVQRPQVQRAGRGNDRLCRASGDGHTRVSADSDGAVYWAISGCPGRVGSMPTAMSRHLGRGLAEVDTVAGGSLGGSTMRAREEIIVGAVNLGSSGLMRTS